MAKRRARAVDPWKQKKWYTIISPQVFGEKEITETAAFEDDMLLGRRLQVLGIELTGNPNHMQYLVTLRIDKVVGNKAYTDFEGLELERSFIKRYTRRHTSKVESVFDAETKDGKLLHIKLTVWTAVKVSGNTATDMRKIGEEMMRAYVVERTKDEALMGFLEGDISKLIAARLKKLAPIRRVEVSKSYVVMEERAVAR